MTDVSNVIENIESGLLMARGTDTKLVHMTVEHVEKVLELLKEREPIKPKMRLSETWLKSRTLYYCGVCDTRLIRRKQEFCSKCGRPVKWEE